MSNIEAAKKNAAETAVRENFPKDAKYVGIGSGTTVVYVVEAIKNSGLDTSKILFVPTGDASKQVVANAGLTPIAFDALPDDVILDIAFDGADEVDDELNCIKGGGACLFQEKIVAMQAKKFVCVADHRKLQSRLLTNWKYIPIEVAPIAAKRVIRELKKIGSTNPVVRENKAPKTGSLKTDQDFFIIDAPFKQLLTAGDVKVGKDGSGKDGVWEVEALADKIKSIVGVLDVGIFCGKNGNEMMAAANMGGQKPVAAYFGMEDGSVSTRRSS
ncbi:MAG: ribose-5-phosphate isomerase rki1 [Cirrosporium novae-zelandiae]|nr:MAG: ribose-5-phosphate isomerase rki1 [Cirrosporium novae-zelandiae]